MTPKRVLSDDEDQEEGNDIDYSSPVKKTRKDAPHQEVRSPLTSINKAGKPAEAGIILRIQVINFMCHRNLTVNLCRNVNFIHGQNGSGKSAILAALQICLGANARRTHRARNLKDLVRKESKCNGAKVRVTLLNKGPDAFQPDKYPDSITIEKSISLTSGGFNGYKLLDKSNKEQSRSKKDLDTLLDQLNIQVENPVAVLDQEEAKKFLTGKAEDKYNFFTKATDLERMDRHYAAVLDDMQDMEENKLRIQQNLKPLADNVKKLKAEYDELAKLDKLEKKLEELGVKYSWAVYAECNDQLKESQEVLAKIEEKRAKLHAEIEKLSSSEGDGSEEEIALKNELNALMEEASEAKEKHAELSRALKVAEAPKKQKERELKHVQGEVATASRHLKNAERELENYRQEIIRKTGSAQSEEAKRASRMKEAEENMAKLKENIELWAKDIDGSVRMYEEKEPRESALKSQVESINKQIYAVKNKVQSLQNSEGSSMAMFGPKTIEVFRMVEHAKKAGKFRGEVIGPIGNYLKIMQGKEEYAALAEAAFSIKLDRFIVTNDHDRDIFMSIRKQAKCSPRDCGVFQSATSARYRTTAPPSNEVDTVATVLNIANDLVFNCLVDNAKIDTIALCKSKAESEEALLVTHGNGKNSIRGNNIKTVYFLPDGDYWQVSRDGQLSMYSLDKQMKQTIGVDRTAAIREGQREQQQLENERRQLSRQLEEVSKERHAYKVQWNKLQQESNMAKANIMKLQERIDAIRDEAEAAENVTFDTSELEDEVRKAQDKVDEIKTRQQEIRRAIEEMTQPIQDVLDQLEEVRARNTKISQDISASEDRYARYLQEKQEKSRAVEKKRQKLKEVDGFKANQSAKVHEHEKNCSDTLQKARVITRHWQQNKPDLGEGEAEIPELEEIEPIDVTKDATFYQSKIDKARREIEREKSKKNLQNRDSVTCYENYLRAKQDLDSKMIQIEKINENMEHLQADLSDRKAKWKAFRHHICEMTNTGFDAILNKKGSSGQLTFNHKEKTLDLMVQKDNTNEGSQTADVKALSGGERSYTTLSLLLALGECLETPFRVMDEFDVFLDVKARKLALTTMIALAKQMSHRQFIFITPQDLSDIKTDDMLSIHHMNPPDRSQLVGGLQQQTLD